MSAAADGHIRVGAIASALENLSYGVEEFATCAVPLHDTVVIWLVEEFEKSNYIRMIHLTHNLNLIQDHLLFPPF